MPTNPGRLGTTSECKHNYGPLKRLNPRNNGKTARAEYDEIRYQFPSLTNRCKMRTPRGQKMHIKTLPNRPYPALWLSIALLMACTPLLARAQSNLPDEAYSMYRISLTKKDISVLVRTVIGDETQPEAILTRGLYDGYVNAWDSIASQARQGLKDIASQSSGKGADYYRNTIRPQIAKEQAAWVIEAKNLENQFLSDVYSILTEKEQARWPLFEQARRRSILLRRYSRLAGEGVDLINITNILHFPDEVMTTLEPTLADYAGELDKGILDRQEVMGRAKERMTAIANGQSQESKEVIYSDILRVHKKLRDINENYAEQIEQQLPDDLAATFKQKFDQSRYPRLFAPTQADRYMTQVRRLDSLTDIQKERIEARWSQYEIELEPIITQLMDLQKKREEEVPYQYRSDHTARPQSVTGSTGTTSATVNGPASGSIKKERDLWQKRQALETKLIDDIFTMLTDEQRLKAPKSSSARQPGGFPTGPLERPGDGG